jgi:hypothetical protein
MNSTTEQLLSYLEAQFISEETLLNRLKTDKKTLTKLQSEGKAPKPSYELQVKLGLKAPSGSQSQLNKERYYAQGYEQWVNMVIDHTDSLESQAIFSHHYKTQIHTLMHIYAFPKSVEEYYTQESHIKEKWDAFLNGHLGQTTKTGLPTDIATQSIALEMLDYLTGSGKKETLAEDEALRLKHWIACLEEITPPTTLDIPEVNKINSLLNNVKLKYFAHK